MQGILLDWIGSSHTYNNLPVNLPVICTIHGSEDGGTHEQTNERFFFCGKESLRQRRRRKSEDPRLGISRRWFGGSVAARVLERKRDKNEYRIDLQTLCHNVLLCTSCMYCRLFYFPFPPPFNLGSPRALLEISSFSTTTPSSYI